LSLTFPPVSEDKLKVVYVMGAGRSGSTILGITLGNCTNVFYAGELNLWLGRQGRSPLPGAERVRFWDAVREEVASDLPGRQARNLEKTASLFDVRSWPSQRRLRKRYRRVTEDLYRSIALVAGATHIVDSSHFPRRAKELQKLVGIDLYLLFLTRDPQNVVASYVGDDMVFPRFNTVNTNVYLWLTYLLSLFVFLRHPRDRRLLVSYEGFIADPEGVLRDILGCIGSNASTPDLRVLDTGVAFHGNPILRAEVVALEDRPRTRSRGSRMTAIMQSPWVALLSRLRPAAGSGSSAGSGSRASGLER
jgi:hypothetical protein